MKLSLSTARFAAVLAVAAVVFGAGLVSGAAGQPLIMGSTTNSAGSSATKMSSNVNGNAFAVAQTGSGNAANGIRGDASQGTGGVFTSSSNNALFATAASGNRFAMVAVSNGAAGTGGALFADGNANPAIDMQTNSGVPPMTVNSDAQVVNLNGDETDGWDVGCPGGTTWAGGLCLETSMRTPATIYDAAVACAALGSDPSIERGQQWMLPSLFQLYGAATNDDITLAETGEWTDVLYVDDALFSAMMVYQLSNGVVGTEEALAPGSLLPYRCGAVPLSVDPVGP